MCIEFNMKENKDFVWVEFELKRELKPDDLKNISPPDAVKGKFANKGIVLSGKGPVWLYGFLVHFYHATKFVAVFEPRINAAVVVETHCVDYQVGDVINV